MKDTFEKVFENAKEELKKYADSITEEDLKESEIGYMLCRMDSEDVDLTFSGNIEQAERIIVGLLRAFPIEMRPKMLLKVVTMARIISEKEEMGMLDEDEIDTPIPIIIKKSKLMS